MSVNDKRRHTIIFEKPGVAQAFAHEALIKSIVTIESVDGSTVLMTSSHQLWGHHTTFIQAEARTFGKVEGWKFNLLP